MNEFINMFGDVTISKIVTTAVAVIFMLKIYEQIKSNLIEKHEREKAKDEKLQAVIEQVSEYPEWHAHSLEIQERFSKAIENLNTQTSDNSETLKRLERLISESETTVCRYRILRFNDEIQHDTRHSKEHFNQILDDITSYERYCDNHPEYENGRAVLAIANIKRVYEKCSKDNSFL